MYNGGPTDFAKANVKSTTPQGTRANPNTATAVPQELNVPPQMNSAKVAAENASLQSQGMAPSQSMAIAGNSPNNASNKLTLAQGGAVTNPPTPDQIQAGEQKINTNSKDFKILVDALNDKATMKRFNETPQQPTQQQAPAKQQDSMSQMFQDYASPQGQQYLQDRSKLVQQQNKANPEHYAKGGAVGENIKNMSLKDAIKLLASHPEVSQQFDNAKTQQPSMNQGGLLSARLSKDTHQGSRNTMSNVDVAGYASGGDVNSVEQDQITGFGPDGSPIMQNADGTQSMADINSYLGRPSSAPTAGTGQVSNASTANAANGVSATKMATGGEMSGPPPGSLKEEVADDVPAKLSVGEFVFSADVVRYYGLRFLNGLMEHARDALQEMSNEGNIRYPGDEQKPKGEGLMSSFMQDAPPNMHAYDQQDDELGDKGADDEDIFSDGLLKECMGGSVSGYASGGDVTAEEQQYKVGGVVGSTAPDLSVKGNHGAIPTGGKKLAGSVDTGISAAKYDSGKFKPKFSKGGILEDKLVPHQQYVT